ncbi:MAG: hypothetical protein ACRDRL_20405, partial [Sciscionella sp.]
QWASGGAAPALVAERQGHTDTALLCAARASARSAAARVLRGAENTENAVGELMHAVAQLRVISPPLRDFDAAMLAYTQARTLQACARELDHTITELQPRWS